MKIQRILDIALFALSSAAIFLLFESAFEYIWANWISRKPAWPDQKSITWLIRSGIFETAVYLIALLVGTLLSLRQFNQLKTPHKIALSITIAFICGGVFAVFGLMEMPDDPRISLGVVLLWPVLVVIISSVGLRHWAKRAL